MSETTRAAERLRRFGDVLDSRKRKVRLLEEIAWPREVEERFFASGASELPEPSYEVDRAALEADIAALQEAERTVEGDDALATWLRSVVTAQVDADRLLLAVGTRRFGELSRELYGSARSPFFGGAARNVDLADHLLERLHVHGWDETRDEESRLIPATELAATLEARIAARTPRFEVEVRLDDRCSAKVLAGMSRVRVRRDATFRQWEAEGLYQHEVETHALTAQNGAAQEGLSWLRSGGPRTTLTQEGLAIFAELWTHTLSVQRLERLAVRVKLTDMAEEGANFLELYRFLLERGVPPRDAYLDAQRICRGGLPTGGAPFTKDSCYLAGLLHVYAFLSAVVRGGFRDEVELLVCGRISLDDVAALSELRTLGLLTRPKFLPGWLASWETLLPYFAFASFMDEIDLAPVEAHYREVIRLALAAKPRSKDGS